MATKIPHVHAGNSASTKVPRPHAELIKQWADGAEIQWYNNVAEQWESCGSHSPCWDKTTKYRVKPEPKPDLHFSVRVSPCKHGGGTPQFHLWNCLRVCSDSNLMLVFDGETGKLKDCQVLAKE